MESITDFKGSKFAVVTGASSGIGYELAREFAQHGYDLLIAAEDGGIVEAAQAFNQMGVHVESIQVDLANFDGVERLVERIQTSGRPIDAIAVNAGVGVGGDFARQTDLKEELNLINLNVTSSVHLTKRILQQMIPQNRGRILITSSVASAMPGTYEAVYGASKAFLESFAQSIRNELKDTGITITTLLPGPTDTNFFHRAHMDDTKVGAGQKDDPAEVARDGYEALMAGDDHVIAGSFKNKMFVAGGKILPDTTMAQVHRGMSEPGSANK